MLNSFENLFYEPIKELDNFQLVKENTSFQDFIMIYEQTSDDEEKIKILKSLKSICNHKYSQINISTICSANNNSTLEIKNEMEIDSDLKIDKLNLSDYTNSNKEYIRWITNEFFSVNNEKIKQYLSDILILIINVKGVNKYDISKIYEEFSKIYFYSEQQLNINEFLKHIKFLSLFYGFKEGNSNENINYIQSKINNKPYNYYFFQGSESIKISPSITSNEKSKLKDGLSIYICFNCLLNPKYNKKKSNKCTIFSIHFQNYNKLTLYIDDKMNLSINLYDDKNKKDNLVMIDKIENNKWYNIGINLNSIKKNKKFPLTILINNVVNNNIKDIECQNIKLNEINNITICEDFIGFITNILLFNKFIDIEELNFFRTKYKYGLYKFKHISKFIDKLNEDLLKHLIVLLIPMENNNEDKTINNLANDYTNDNIVNNFDIKFNSNYLVNNNVNINYHLDNKINLLGGIENILPLCEILIKISKDLSSKDLNIFQQCIHIIIKIINTILINHKTNTGELADSKFFEIFSLFLQSININLNNKTKMELLNENIMYSLNDLTAHLINNSSKYPKQCKSYLNNLILNIKIIGKFSLQNQNMIFDFVAKHINSVNAENLIDHEKLLYLIEYYNEYYKQYFCCQEHQKFYGDKKKVMDLKTPFDLLTKIIGFSVKYDEDIYIRILHLLAIKSQPCLIKYIIKNIFILNLAKTDTKKNEKSKFIKFLVKNNLLYILLFLLSTYVYPDIIFDIINIFSILSVQSNPIDNNNFFTRENIINYIANSILPIYIRIQKKDINIIEEEQKLALRPKFLAASEIIFSKGNDNNILNDNDNDLNEEDNLEDEYLGVNTYNNKFNLRNSEKLKINYRKKSDDNYLQNHKFNLNNLHELDLNDNYHTNLTKKKSYDDNDNDNSESEEKNRTPVLKSPKKIKSLIQNIKKISSISDKKLKIYYNTKSNIEMLYEKKKEEYNKLAPILEKINKNQMSSFIQTILDSLLNWLKIDFKNYVMKIIYIFFKINKIEYLHIYKFIETVNIIINEKISNKNNNLSIKLFSIDFYFWCIDIMFQFYLKKNNREDLITISNAILFSNEDKDLKNVVDIILQKGLKILVNFIVNIKFETKELIKLFDDLLLCGTKIKKYYSLNKNTISYLNNFYLELFTSILKEYHKYHSQNNSEEIVPIINICYEYMIFFNNENKSEEINNFLINDNQIFNGIILSGVNTNNINSSNNEISKFWTDYTLFENIISILKQTINIESIDYKDDSYLEENILSHKKSDTYLEQILFLCNLKNGSTNNNSSNNNINDDTKNEQLPLLYIISNLYAITLNLSNNKIEKEKILQNYKLYIIFLILSSSNLSYNPSLTNIIQSKVELIIIYFIGFMIERYNNGLDKDLSISILNEVFILMIKVLKRANDQIQNKKNNKIFTKIISMATTQKKIDFSKCAVFRIFSKDSMANVFNKDFVKTIRKNNFKFFDDKTYLIQLLLSCLDIKSIQKDVKNIFCADKFIQKGHERVREINELKYKESLTKEENVNCYDLSFFKTRKKISNIIDNSLFALEEELKIFKEYQYLDKLKIKNNYKKAKKNLFSFCGLWSNKDIFYKNKLKEEDDDKDNEENKSNDNSLDEALKEKENKNIYKNKFILKYKLSNHYGKSPFRPILSPIYDINSYLPCFSQFNKDNLFIEKKEGQNIIAAINLNMAQIFNDENNSYSFTNTAGNEETDSILSNIYQINFIDAYNHYINKIVPIYNTEKLSSSPLSGIVSNSHQCCYVTQMSHIKGYLYLNKSYCSFVQNIYNSNNDDDEKKLKEDEDYDEEKKMCYGSYIKLNKSKYVCMDVKYKSIQYIFLRKYYYKDSAVEIFTSKNKVYYFNFQDSFKRQCFLNLLLNKFAIKKEIKILKNKLIGYEVSSSNTNNIKNNNSDFLFNLIENWQDWKISTMELILWLNVLSNRSFNDISQYPVFPWILIKYEDNFSSEKKISLSKSFMPKFKSNKLKNMTTSIIKSNSDDIKNNKINFKKNKENTNDNAIEEKNEIEEAIINSGDNNIIEEDEKNKYDPFPIKDKESKIILDKDIRNFALPMGMMNLTEEGEKRKNNYILKYTMMKKEIEANEKENKNNKNNNSNYINTKIYIYGSHYSNPLYVCHYLTRIFPFSNISIELQGDKFDDPNRLLISVNKSFEASSSHEGDVRELCPEFFYLPEIFMNRNNLDLKIKSKNYKENSNDVILPKWADNDNYIFITKLKTYLESEEVNKKINKWFDLIFGYKQKGKEAENAYNLFIPSSYDIFDLKNEVNSPDQKQYFLRLIEFGLTPHQIFSKKFMKRKQKNNKNKMISESCREIELKINEFERKDNKNELKVLKLKFIDNENIFVILNNFQFIKYEISNYHELNSENKTIRFDSKQNPPNNYITSEKIPKLNYLRNRDNKSINKSYPIIIYDKGTYIATGGYYDGKIIVSQLNNKNSKSKSKPLIVNIFEVINPMDNSQVNNLIINKSENFILSGSIQGTVVIYNNKKNLWKKKSQINDHLNTPITSLFFNDNLNIWGSAACDGYVNLYTFPTNRKICSIKVDSEGLYADFLFIVSSPLPSFVIHCKNNFCFYSYSLIGKQICKEYEIDSEIYSPLLIEESNFGEILIYGDNKGRINMRYLPSLCLFFDKGISKNMEYFNVDNLEVSENGKYCIAWNNDNDIFYVIYDNSNMSETEELMILHLANDFDD